MRLRRTAIAAVMGAGIIVPALSTAAVAFAQPASVARPASVLKAAPKTTRITKPVKTVRFEASGTVTALDDAAGVVTLQARVTFKNGKRTVKKTVITTVTVAANARIVVNGAKATLASVAVGQRIVVTGTRSGTDYTATKVVTMGRKGNPAPSPKVTPSPTPSVTPSTEPSVEPTSETPTEEPSDR